MNEAEQKALQTFWQKLEDSAVVMLGIAGEEGHSEPMVAKFDSDYPNTLFFYTTRDNRIAQALTPHTVAMVQFASKGHDFFACLRGNLSLCDDQIIVDRFWSRAVESWYPQGKSDPSLRMLRLTLLDAELWDNDVNPLRKLQLTLGGGLKKQEAEERHVQVQL